MYMNKLQPEMFPKDTKFDAFKSLGAYCQPATSGGGGGLHYTMHPAARLIIFFFFFKKLMFLALSLTFTLELENYSLLEYG